MKKQDTDNQKKATRNQSTGSRDQAVRQSGVEDNSNTVKTRMNGPPVTSP